MSSGEGYPAGSVEAYIAIRERQREYARRMEEAEERDREMIDEISDVKRRQTEQGARLSEVIEFHKELKRYAFVAIVGVFGILGTSVWSLIVHRP